MEKSAQQETDESWRRGSLQVRGLHLLDSGYMADCTFLLKNSDGEEVRIPGHRLLLSHSSPVLEAMLSETWRAQEKREIRIEGVTAECFRLLLGYVYTGQTPDLDMDSALELLAAAHMYLVSDLIDACVKHITASLSAEKVCQVLEVASTLSLDGLHSIAVQYLVENTSSFLSAPSFPECSAATLRLILEQDSLSLSSELELVQACLRWGQHQLQQTAEEQMDDSLTVRAALGDLVFLLRLRGLTTEQLARHVVPSGLLTDKEQSAVLCCLATKGDSPMPGGFTAKIRTYIKKSQVDGPGVKKCQIGGPGVHELSAASTVGDVQTLQCLLRAGVPVDARESQKTNRALITAAQKGQLECVRVLMDHGADPEEKSVHLGKTPLHVAVHYGHPHIVRLLIERGCCVNVTDFAGNAPLHNVIASRNLEMVRALLEAGADPRAATEEGYTPLLLASVKGAQNSEMIEIINQYL